VPLPTAGRSFFLQPSFRAAAHLLWLPVGARVGRGVPLAGGVGRGATFGGLGHRGARSADLEAELGCGRAQEQVACTWSPATSSQRFGSAERCFVGRCAWARRLGERCPCASLLPGGAVLVAGRGVSVVGDRQGAAAGASSTVVGGRRLWSVEHRECAVAPPAGG
jgi:hypothetical protein